MAETKPKTSKVKRASTKKVEKKEAKQTPVVAPHEVNRLIDGFLLPRRVVAQIAEEVAARVTSTLKRPAKKKVSTRKIENPIFLDTSAIIDARVFELIRIGIFTGTYVILDGVLDELKNIADSKDQAKKERGRKGLALLEQLRKDRKQKFTTFNDSDIKKPVDERIIEAAKKHQGKIVTCDYNLSKKAQITSVTTINMYELANVIKTTALPGETFYIKVVQKGKGEGQGVGYLPDGTMVVVEEGAKLIDQTVRVLISRVIQTDVGRIFFGKIVAG